MSGVTHNLEKEIKGYIIVGTGLLTLTIVTVAVSYLHLNLAKAIILALFIATIKGSMVACYFMHLISERHLIYSILGFVVIFLFCLLFLPLAETHSVPHGTQHIIIKEEPKENGHHVS